VSGFIVGGQCWPNAIVEGVKNGLFPFLFNELVDVGTVL